MKFAFIILGDFDAVRDRAEIRGGRARIWGVSSLAEACAAAKALEREGGHRGHEKPHPHRLCNPPAGAGQCIRSSVRKGIKKRETAISTVSRFYFSTAPDPAGT